MVKNVHDLCLIFFRFGENEHISHFRPLSSQILRYINLGETGAHWDIFHIFAYCDL